MNDGEARCIFHTTEPHNSMFVYSKSSSAIPRSGKLAEIRWNKQNMFKIPFSTLHFQFIPLPGVPKKQQSKKLAKQLQRNVT